MKRTYVLFGLLLALAAVVTPEVHTLKDVTYGAVNGKDLQLDAYLSEGAAPSPAVVFIHGGGWRGGDKAQVPEFLRRAMFDAGVSIISINYRLSGEALYPAQVDDTTRAVQFVRYQAKEWRLKPDRIAVMGPSAGGHLSLWIGLHDDRANPKSSDLVERQSSRACAIVNYFGPTDFHLLQTMPHRHPAYLQLFGFKEGDPPSSITDAEMTAVSPISYVSSNDPPVFTAHGTGDQTVPVEHAKALIAKLKDKRVTQEYYLLEGGNHGLSNPQPSWPDYRKATIEFLRKYLLQ